MGIEPFTCGTTQTFSGFCILGVVTYSLIRKKISKDIEFVSCSFIYIYLLTLESMISYWYLYYSSFYWHSLYLKK